VATSLRQLDVKIEDPKTLKIIPLMPLFEG
jgi:hypothetical protein